MKQSLKIIPIILVLVLIVAWLKPSYSRFKDFASDLNSDEQQKVVTRRLNDYFLWVYFKKDIYRWVKYSKRYELQESQTYLGYLLNFHKIK
jgi:hypothetical protein